MKDLIDTPDTPNPFYKRGKTTGGNPRLLKNISLFAYKEVSDIPRKKEPIDLIQAKGKKHLTKDEIEERKAKEPEVVSGDVRPPDYLPKKFHEKFEYLAGLLEQLKITKLDADCLANFIAAQDLYFECTKKISANLHKRPPTVDKDLQMQQDRAFKQAYQWARELGLTISSRGSIEVPKALEDVDDGL